MEGPQRGCSPRSQLCALECLTTCRQLAQLHKLQCLGHLIRLNSWWSRRRWRLDNFPASSEHFTLATKRSCHCPAANLSNLSINLLFPISTSWRTVQQPSGAATRVSNPSLVGSHSFWNSCHDFLECHLHRHPERPPQESRTDLIKQPLCAKVSPKSQ